MDRTSIRHDEGWLLELEHDAMYGLDRFARLANLIEESLQGERCRQEKRRENAESGVTRLIGDMEYTEAQSVLPQAMRNSLLVSLCSLIEFELLFISDKVLWAGETGELERLQRKGAKAVLPFLRRRGVDPPDYFAQHGVGRFYWEVRNAIVHNGGFFDRERKDRYELSLKHLPRVPDICLWQGSGRISLGDEFIPEAIEDGKTMFRELCTSIRKLG